jgi:hypothetical protein
VTGERRDEMKKQPKKFERHVTVEVGPVVQGEKECYCRVHPSVVHVQHGGTVTFKAVLGCGPLQVFVPTPRRTPKPFPHVPKGLSDVPATRKGKKLRVTHVKGRWEFPYAIYCRGCNCFGQGSMPRMIVGP